MKNSRPLSKNSTGSKKTLAQFPGNEAPIDPMMALGLGFIGLGLVLNFVGPGAQQKRALDKEVRTEFLSQEASAARANARYRDSCYMAVDPNITVDGYHVVALALSESSPAPVDPTTGQSMDGRTVCDDRGFTAIVEDGRLRAIAISDDAELINKRFDDALGWHERACRSGQCSGGGQ